MYYVAEIDCFGRATPFFETVCLASLEQCRADLYDHAVGLLCESHPGNHEEFNGAVYHKEHVIYAPRFNKDTTPEVVGLAAGAYPVITKGDLSYCIGKRKFQVTEQCK